MTIILKLFKLVFPLLKEYGISNLRMKRGGGKKVVVFATAATLFVLTMFVGYLAEQANTNLRLHEPLARQYQSLERNNQRLSQQLEAARQSMYSCEAVMQELKGNCIVGKAKPSAYDPDKKIMVQPPDGN